MKDFNQVILIGRLGKDPESKYSAKGTQIVKFSLATGRSFKRGDDWETITTWHNVICYGRDGDNSTLATRAGEFRKGQRVLVVGRVETRSYEQDGVTKWITEIIATDVAIQQKRDDDDAPRDTDTHTKAPSKSKGNVSAEPEFDDDIPF